MKKTNKGFSMVELIIVIAIMAILAGAIAPALIKYINKSRLSSDISNGQTIATSIQTALSDESGFSDAPTVKGVELSTLSGTNFEAALTQTLSTWKTMKCKAKKDASGATVATTTAGSYYVTIDPATSTIEVYCYDTSPDHMVYPTVGAKMEK